MIKENSLFTEGIAVKKQYGQHFLRDQQVIDMMIESVKINTHSSILEIGCGDGFLTKSILSSSCKQLWIFEIDAEWAKFVEKKYADTRMSIFCENILDLNFERLVPDQPWILLANIPYQITFPILFSLQKHRMLFQEGVIMVQEEVAQKLTKKSGRGFGFISLFFQRFFQWTLLCKVPADSFLPPPKVDSRLLHFIPKKMIPLIPNEDEFFIFVKACFVYPRRTLKNNLRLTNYQFPKEFIDTLGNKRAEECTDQDFLYFWNLLNSHKT